MKWGNKATTVASFTRSAPHTYYRHQYSEIIPLLTSYFLPACAHVFILKLVKIEAIFFTTIPSDIFMCVIAGLYNLIVT